LPSFSSEELFNETLADYASHCFQRESDWSIVIDRFQWWTKGVGLLALGLSGLVGNLLSIAVLRKIQSNRCVE